jgi:chromosome segregation ATPase
METTLVKTPASRSGERILEALATLAALLDRTMNEVKNLDREFDSRLNKAIHDVETRVRDDVTTGLTERFQQEMQSVIEVSRMEFETERERINGAMNKAVQASSNLQGERERLHRDLTQAVESASVLEKERSRLQSEIRSLREQVEKAEKEAEKARKIAESAEHTARTAAGRGEAPAEIVEEMAKIEGKIREISAEIEDPSTELTVVIRKNVERSELDSYLKGIRLVVDTIGK